MQCSNVISAIFVVRVYTFSRGIILHSSLYLSKILLDIAKWNMLTGRRNCGKVMLTKRVLMGDSRAALRRLILGNLDMLLHNSPFLFFVVGISWASELHPAGLVNYS